MASWVWRRSWLVLVCALLVLLVAHLVAEVRASSFTAEADLVVPSGAGQDGPGAAYEATTLAGSYAEAIPRDDDVLAEAADATGMGVVELRDGLAVSVVDGTALLRIRFTADSAEAASAGASAVAEAVLDAESTADVFPRGSVELSSLPSPGTVEESGAGELRPIGLLLGLALGLVLAVAWERSDRRIDTVEQLGDTVGAPSTDVTDMPAGAVAVMGERWRHAAGSPAVAMLPAVPGHTAGTRATAERLGEALRSQGHSVHVGEPPAPAGWAGLALLHAGALGHEQGETALLGVDVATLVVPRGTPQRRVEQAVDELRQLGAPVDWAFLGPAGQSRRARLGRR